MSNSEPILSEYLTKAETAAELRRSVRTLDYWYRIGMGPPRVVMGRTVLYRRSSLATWLASRERKPVAA